MSTPVTPRHRTGASGPLHPSPLRADITRQFEEVLIREEEDGDKTPTQPTFGLSMSPSGTYPDTPTPVLRDRDSSIVVGGRIRKSASNLELQTKEDDDVFGDNELSPSYAAPFGSSSLLQNSTKTNTSGKASEAINIINRNTSEYQRIRGYNGFMPRNDRGLEPNVHNAQGIFPPDANIFVANLSNQLTQEQLEVACHEIFDIYGRNYIQVKFDKNKQPFALIQFETVDDADMAIKYAQGSHIDSREIRVERTKAERAVIIFKPSGAHFSDAEARNILSRYGALEMIIPTSLLKRQAPTIPRGFYVRFAFYLDCRDALKGVFSDRSPYRIQLASGIEPADRYLPTYNNSAARSRGNARSITDCKSIYVGNLPFGTSQTDLINIFGPYGTIVDANVVHKQYPGNSINIFGFVEFVDSSHAIAAANDEQYLGDQKLRVEPKEYSARRARAMNSESAPTPSMTPRRISPGANAALALQLARNELENNTLIQPPPQFNPPTPASSSEGQFETPRHYLPAHLFSPSPGPYFDGAADYYPCGY